MELQERPRANDSGLPDGAADRLLQFAMEHQLDAFPPERVFVGAGDERTFSDEFLRYCRAAGMSLDWFYFGEGRPFVKRRGRA